MEVKKMIRLKSTILVVILMVLAIFTVGITAEAVLKKNEQNNIVQQSMIDVEITFTVQTGEGCACDPIEGALVAAYGGEGNDSAFTDENGMCVLNLVILGEYEVFIEADGFLNVYIEFNVVDDQTFIIHMFEKEESSTPQVSLYQAILTRILNR
jgi:hypothetical protein